MKRLALASALAGALCLPSAAAAAPVPVAVLGAPATVSWNDEVKAKLLATGQFSSVDTFDVETITPTLAQLQNYCAVLVYSNGSFHDASTLGDNLADYIDAGGGVVAAVFTMASVPIGGRFATDDYWAIEPSGPGSGPAVLGTIFVPAHPILSGVVSFDGGTASFRPTMDLLHPSATRIANWSVGTVPLVATRTIGSTRRADLGFFPPSTDSRGDLWNAATDGDLLMANALTWTCNVCGDGVTEGGEQCDDGNLSGGDCCSASCQFEADGAACTSDSISCTIDTCDGAGSCEHSQEPLDTGDCLVAPKAKLQIKDSATAGKDKLSWQWTTGAAFDQADLGDPLAGTSYRLCVYDTTATVPSLEASIDIAPSATLWVSKDPKGLQYKDKAGASDGITKVQLKTGDGGKTKAKVSAGGLSFALPPPAGATYFLQDPNVVVQLVNSAGTCWTSEFDAIDTKTNDADSFKAQVK